MSKLMGELSDDELRERAFRRIACVLWSFWDEQQHVVPRAARVSTRVFDHLIYEGLIFLGTSVNGGGHVEHVVPCVFIRDRAFDMFWDGKTQADVALMVGRLLRVAHITKEEAHRIDHELEHKTVMPLGWDSETGSILARLELAGIQLATQ